MGKYWTFVSTTIKLTPMRRLSPKKVIRMSSLNSLPNVVGSTTTAGSSADLRTGSSIIQEEVTKAWQDIFRDDFENQQYGSAMANDALTQRPPLESDRSSTAASSEQFHFLYPQNSKGDGVSLFSILPGGITISSDLVRSPSHRRRMQGNRFKSLFVSCCGSDPYNATKKKFCLACLKIEDFFNDLKKDLEKLEDELYLETPLESPEELNVIGAQIWFVTLAFSRQIAGFPLDTDASKEFAKKYQLLVDKSRWLEQSYIVLSTTLVKFGEIVASLKSVKKIYMGTSEADLAGEQIGEESMVGREQSSVTELAVRALVYRKLWENRRNIPMMIKTTPSKEYMTYGPDTLRDRKEMDIFMRNVTKTGWVNFQVHFLPETRIQLLQDVLSQAVHGLKVVRRVLPAVEKKYKRGAEGCCIQSSCASWFKKIVGYVDFIVSSDKYNSKDNEIVRLQIFAIEILLRNMITRGNTIRKAIRNIIEMVVLSCDYLEHKFFFRIPRYDSIVHLRVNWYQSTNKKEEKFDEGTFFLKDYIIALRHVPIRYGMAEFVLLNRISLSRRHSGVNFDGPRFLSIG